MLLQEVILSYFMHAACSVSREKCRYLHFQSRMGYYPQPSKGQGHTERHFEHDNVACADFTAQGIQLPTRDPLKYNGI